MITSSSFNPDPRAGRCFFDLDLRANNGTLDAGMKAEFNCWLRTNKSGFIKLYHATDAAKWPQIAHQGLRPASATRRNSLQSRTGYTCLSYDPARAQGFAEMAFPGKNLVIIQAVLTIQRLQSDLDQLRNKRMWGSHPVEAIGDTLADSFAYGGGASVRGAVDRIQLSIIGKAIYENRRWETKLEDPGASNLPTTYSWSMNNLTASENNNEPAASVRKRARL